MLMCAQRAISRQRKDSQINVTNKAHWFTYTNGLKSMDNVAVWRWCCFI